MRGEIDRPSLYRARWSNVLRLARALKLRAPPGDCSCVRCISTLIERIVRAAM